MARNDDMSTWTVLPLSELVGTKHDSLPPCALCAALLAEGVLGEGSIMDSLLAADVMWVPMDHVNYGE